MALWWTLDKIGPMARSADDSRVLEGIAGPDAAIQPRRVGRFKPMDARAATAAVKRARLAFAQKDIDDQGGEAKRALEQAWPSSPPGAKVRARRVSGHAVRPARVHGVRGRRLDDLRGAIEGERFEELVVRVEGRPSIGSTWVPTTTSRCAPDAVSAAFEEIFKTADVILSVGRTVAATAITQASTVRA